MYWRENSILDSVFYTTICYGNAFKERKMHYEEVWAGKHVMEKNCRKERLGKERFGVEKRTKDV